MQTQKRTLFHPGYFLVLFSLANTILFYFLGLHYLKISLSSSTLFATTFYYYSSVPSKLLVLLFIFMTYL